MPEVIVYLFASYFLGAIPFSIIIGYAFVGLDVRRHGSRNAGATNVYRVAGLPAAIVAAILDAVKGAIPVVIARYLLDEPEWVQLAAGFAAVIGHILPVYVGFKGGKGVNTLLGMLAVLLPAELGICLVAFALVFGLTRIVSVSSLVAGVTLSVIVVIERYAMGKNISDVLISACLAITLLVFFTHRANIRRLLRGEEKKLTRRVR